MVITRLIRNLVASTAVLATLATSSRAADERDYYRLVSIITSKAPTGSRAKFWKPPPKDLVLEVSGMAVLDDKRLAVTIRKGEVWFLGGVYDDPPGSLTYKRFAHALHEPLGLLKHGDGFYTAQRTELTKLRDIDGDDVADEYLSIANGWGVTGNYHEYAYGPKLGRDGNLWLTLNIGMGFKGDQRTRMVRNKGLGVAQARWRGWGVKITPQGKLIPVCAGMRSPSGLGANRAGDMFYTDQQGNWVGTNSLHHMRSGAFFHHPEALASMDLPGSPLRNITEIPNGLPFPEAARRLPALKPPAVWFPYKKVGQSATDIVLDNSRGRFGPFDGQLFVGEFTLASISRVFLEKIDGQYQGACFPFREGMASAVIRLAQGTDGSLFAGLSNRGWSSLGTASYGLQRLVWSGKMPFEIKELRARPDGFELVLTKPVDSSTAADTSSFAVNSYTYTYHATYGSNEILKKDLVIQSATVSADGYRIRLKIDGLRQMYVHEIHAPGLRSRDGLPLLHPAGYYTLNRIPRAR
ncbi:MAG: hypothetical protein CMJ65_01985 [Planctomycetaceae bacterium]|jgi:hypothetical protein|nr:hypothetical protein [Planctomycetaceae bacterium]MDP7276059.1 hypothetical protein [Planctomycetaceae bacterium]